MNHSNKICLLVVIFPVLWMVTSCVKQKPVEPVPRIYVLPDLDDEEVEDLPEDTSVYPPVDEY